MQAVILFKKKKCALSLSYHHQSNGQMEACIKLIKCMMKKCHDTKSEIHLALLHVRTSTNPAILLFNFPTRSIMPIIYRVLISIDNNDEYHKILVKRHTKMIRNVILPEIILFFP